MQSWYHTPTSTRNCVHTVDTHVHHLDCGVAQSQVPLVVHNQLLLEDVCVGTSGQVCPCKSVQLSTLPCTCVLLLHCLHAIRPFSVHLCPTCVCVWMKFSPSHRAAPELGEYIHVVVMCLGCHRTLCLPYVLCMYVVWMLPLVIVTWCNPCNPALSAGRLHKVLHGKTPRCQPTSKCYCTALLTRRGAALWSSLFREWAVLCCDSSYRCTTAYRCIWRTTALWRTAALRRTVGLQRTVALRRTAALRRTPLSCLHESEQWLLSCVRTSADVCTYVCMYKRAKQSVMNCILAWSTCIRRYAVHPNVLLVQPTVCQWTCLSVPLK